jgi:hypothetical protein
MPLAALILCGESDPDEGYAILLPVAGQTLLEYQVRTLRAFGVGHLVLLADRLPSGLLATLDRLKSDNIDIDVVRTPSDAADSVHPDEDVLVIAGGMVAPRHQLQRLSTLKGPALLSVADIAENNAFERIDAQSRWTGIAKLDGTLLRETAAMLGDWQLGPTLLRVALQNGVRQIRIDDGDSIMMPKTIAEAASTTAALSNAVRPRAIDWFDRTILAPMAVMLAQKSMARRVTTRTIAVFAAVLTLVAFASVLLGRFWVGTSLLCVVGLVVAIGDVVAQVSARPSDLLDRLVATRAPGVAALLLLCGAQAFALDSDLVTVLAGLPLVSSMIGLAHLNTRIAAVHRCEAGPSIVCFVMTIGFMSGFALASYIFSALYVLASQISLQRQIPRP